MDKLRSVFSSMFERHPPPPPPPPSTHNEPEEIMSPSSRQSESPTLEDSSDSDALEKLHRTHRVGLEDFTMIRVLGKGSFGKVVLVRKKDSGILFAMKVGIYLDIRHLICLVLLGCSKIKSCQSKTG